MTTRKYCHIHNLSPVVTDYMVSHVGNHNDKPSQCLTRHFNMLPVTIHWQTIRSLTTKSNGKDVPVCDRKAYRRRVGISPPILSLDTRCRSVVNLNSRPIYPQEGTLIPINLWLCWTLCLFGHFGVKEISCPSRIPNPDHPACSVISIRTKLFLLPNQSTNPTRTETWASADTDPSCLQYSSTVDVVLCYLRVEFD
jgi:hypothetical protein